MFAIDKIPYIDMMKSRKGDFMKCYVCGSVAEKNYKQKNVCSKHGRFLQMQHTAKADKKYVPSLYELEKLVPSDMVCQDCGSTMHWIDNQNRSLGAVLQHYRNGTLGIVCHGCNVKHGMLPGDSYRDVPVGHKLCRACKTIKPLDMFSKRRDSKKEYPKSNCKACDLLAHQRWRANNPEKYIASNKKHNDLRKKKGSQSGINSI